MGCRWSATVWSAKHCFSASLIQNSGHHKLNKLNPVRSHGVIVSGPGTTIQRGVLPRFYLTLGVRGGIESVAAGSLCRAAVNAWRMVPASMTVMAAGGVTSLPAGTKAR